MCEAIQDWIKNEGSFIAECYRPADSKYFKEGAELLIAHGIEHYMKLTGGMSTPESLIRLYQSYLNIAVGCELLLKGIYLKNGYMINQTTGKKVIKFSDDLKSTVKEGKTYSFGTLIEKAGSTIFNDLNFSEDEVSRIKEIFKLINLKRNNLVHAGKKHYDSFEYPKCIGEAILSLYNQAFAEGDRNKEFCSKVNEFIQSRSTHSEW